MSETGHKFIKVFDGLSVPDAIAGLTIKNASLQKDSNVLSLTVLENVTEQIKAEIAELLSSAYGFSRVDVECLETSVETDVSDSNEVTDEAATQQNEIICEENAEEEGKAPVDADEYTFADLLNKVTSKSPPAASLLAGCKYSLKDRVVTVTLAGGGRSYLDARGITAYLEKQMRAATEKQYSIEYNGVTEVDNMATDEEIVALSTVGKEIVNKETERVLLGNKITKAVVSMSSINEDTGKVCVEGDIFKIDTRETRDGSKLRATIYLTDYTASVAIKLEDFTDKLGYVMDKLSEGKRIRARGIMRYDRFFGDMCLFADDIMLVPRQSVPDTAEEKRVELHLHTNMSSMDGINDIEDYVKRASEWGHKAIAVTDHGVVQSFPAAAAASSKYGVKMLYGVEDYFVNDVVKSFVGEAVVPLDGEFTVFDIETTGTTLSTDRITEIAAVKFRGGEVEEEFQTFCNPERPISEKIQAITGITNEMVADAPKEGEAIRKFLDFCGGSVLVAHNASFDTSFIAAACGRNDIPYTYSHVDTIPLCRKYYSQLKNVRLDTVARHLGYGDFRHHRAIDDTKVLAAIFRDLVERLKSDGVADTLGLNGALDGMNTNSMHRFHQVLLVKNKVGLKNLYKLVSKAHIDNFYYQPRVKKSDLNALREGLIVGSACVEGELYRAFLEARSDDEIREIAEYYDYFEIQPVANNEFLIADDDITSVNSKEDIRAINRKIVELGEKMGKPVVATGDVHFLNPRDSIFREVLMDAVGFQQGETESELYFRSTDNMLREFSYLGEEKAFEVVVTNPNKIADMIEDVVPVPDGTFTPSIEGAETSFRENTYSRAREIYGDPLPEIVEDRLAKEVNSVINNGFSVMYESARRIVKFSNDNGYIVGSRGSVGS
ncbi:MAG: PHP domain-containing protein, partial [Clostridia bacterium]|nr:PHP domain-containing protein [Clostridia bacterium]